MKLIACGVADADTDINQGVVLELAGAIAGILDALTGLFGKNTRWQQDLRDFRNVLRTDLAEGLRVQDLTYVQSTPSRAIPQPAARLGCSKYE